MPLGEKAARTSRSNGLSSAYVRVRATVKKYPTHGQVDEYALEVRDLRGWSHDATHGERRIVPRARSRWWRVTELRISSCVRSKAEVESTACNRERGCRLFRIGSYPMLTRSNRETLVLRCSIGLSLRSSCETSTRTPRMLPAAQDGPLSALRWECQAGPGPARSNRSPQPLRPMALYERARSAGRSACWRGRMVSAAGRAHAREQQSTECAETLPAARPCTGSAKL